MARQHSHVAAPLLSSRSAQQLRSTSCKGTEHGSSHTGGGSVSGCRGSSRGRARLLPGTTLAGDLQDEAEGSSSAASNARVEGEVPSPQRWEEEELQQQQQQECGCGGVLHSRSAGAFCGAESVPDPTSTGHVQQKVLPSGSGGNTEGYVVLDSAEAVIDVMQVSLCFVLQCVPSVFCLSLDVVKVLRGRVDVHARALGQGTRPGH